MQYNNIKLLGTDVLASPRFRQLRILEISNIHSYLRKRGEANTSVPTFSRAHSIIGLHPCLDSLGNVILVVAGVPSS